MSLDIYQTLAAAIALGLLVTTIKSKEHFKDVVIPTLQSTRDASAQLLANFQTEYRGYILPTTAAIEQLLKLRPSAPVDRRLLEIRDLIRTINSSSETAIRKLMMSFDALPATVEIYVNTLDELIKITSVEYERSSLQLSAPVRAQMPLRPNILSDQLRRNPTKVVNEYSHISNTRADLLADLKPNFQAAIADFEIVLARLRILLSQTK